MAYQIALFGPQATRWSRESLGSLQSTLQQNSELAFLIQTLAGIQSLTPVLDKLSKNIQAQSDLQTLKDFAEGKSVPEAQRLSNTILATLTVVSQIVDLSEKTNGFETTPSIKSAQGFCTGFLSAAALSLSRTPKEFQQHVAAAVRLAVCTGFIIDDENAAHGSEHQRKAFSVRWKTAEDRALLETVLDSTPGVYVSCITDDRTLTATVPASRESSFRSHLGELNIPTSAVGLNGSYHHLKHHEVARKLKQICAGNSQLQLPRANSLRLPLLSTSDASIIKSGPLHEIAIDLILCLKAHWFSTVKAAKEATEGEVQILTLGQGNSVPRSLGPRASQAEERNDPPEQPEEIAVVGMACRFPRADSLEDFWQLLQSGSTSIGKLPTERFNPDQISREPKPETFWGNFLERPDTFDHRFFGISGREAKSMDPQQRLAMQVAYEALESSGYCRHPQSKQETDVGCYLGVGSVDYNDNIGSENGNAFSATSSLRAFISGRISHYFGWLGPSITFDTACSSSAVAIHTACRALLGGECTMAVAGGVNVITSPDLHQNLAAASFLNSNGSSRAFDKDAAGYCRGEGAGLLVLKPMSKALADGDNIISVISGSSVNQGSNCTSITVPDSNQQSSMYQKALAQGNLEPSEVTYVEAHGTGTQVGDPIEYNSVKTALTGPKRKDKVFIGSVKDNIGHCEAASGAAGVIKTILMMQHQTIPKQANFATLNPKIKASEQIEVPKSKQDWSAKRRVALVNNYGAAGSNAAIVLREHPISQPTTAPDSGEYPFVLSAKSPASLQAFAEALKSYAIRSNVSVAELAYNLSQKQNPAFEYKAAFVAAETKELLSSLEQLAVAEDKVAKSTRQLPVVLSFGGQTGRVVTISKQLYDSSDSLRANLDRCNSITETLGLPSIFPGIFSEEPMSDMVELHTQLLSLQVSTAQSWIDSGIEVDSVVGHSFGQISALAIAGSLTLEDAFKFVSGRAALIRDQWNDNGVMLSVSCDQKQLEDLVKQVNVGGETHVDVACYNGPKSFVLAGTAVSISKAQELARDLKTTKLNNSHAYHSHLADSIMSDLERVASSIKLSEPRIHVETCSPDATWSEFSGKQLAQHTRQPVYFGDAVGRISARLPSAVWLEAGSSSPVIVMARSVLRSADRSDIFLAIDVKGANASSNLASASLQLWQEGCGAHFWAFNTASKSKYRQLNLPPYQFEPSRHWIEYKPRTEAKPAEQSAETILANKRSLVTLLKNDTEKHDHLFAVDTSTVIFYLAARGHAVTGQSLCPASMYMEVALSGAVALKEGIPSADIRPSIENLTMSSPLGLGGASIVFLRLHKNSKHERDSWGFTIFSRPSMSEGKTTEHASGLVRLLPANDALTEARLSLLKKVARYSRTEQIRCSTSAKGISGEMVYQIFGEVVDYASYYNGVRNIKALETEAVGTVVIPTEQPIAPDALICDPISLDNFLQVAGIHVNCLSMPTKDEVFVCIAVDEVILTESYQRNRDNWRKWSVYTRHDENLKNGIKNDIFVYDDTQQELVVVFLGATFKNVPFKSLARSLANVNVTSKSSQPQTLPIATPSKQPVSKTSPVSSSVETSDIDTNESVSSPPTEASSPPSDFGEKVLKPATDKLQAVAEEDGVVDKVRQMFSDIIEMPVDEIEPSSTLDYLGIDSLLVTEVLQEISARFKIDLSQEQIMECENLEAVYKIIQPNAPAKGSASAARPAKQAQAAKESVSSESQVSSTPSGNDLATVSEHSFAQAKPSYDGYAKKNKLEGFVSEALPIQSALVVRYVVDAFSKLGCDLEVMREGDEVPIIPYKERYSKLIPQLYLILTDAGLLAKSSGKYTRTSKKSDTTPARDLHEEMLQKFPQHASETKLLHTSAPQLAECLSGSVEPLSLLFRDKTALELMTDVYTNAPMFRSGNQLLTEYLCNVIKNADGKGTIRFLELGAGTGGTTVPLLQALTNVHSEQKFSYTFTDLSPSLVAQARKKFSKYDFMEYTTLDIEKEPAQKYFGSFDVVISTNCIHATKNLVNSTTNIRKLLSPAGILCLVELTRNLFWFDLVFGLVEGWWLFNDGRNHALAHEYLWKQNLRAAGYKWVDWSDTESAESDICRVITASPSDAGGAADDNTPEPPVSGTNFMKAAVAAPTVSADNAKLQETLTFKEVDGLKLDADIYYPPRPVEAGQNLPVALMIHGGGHIMLSRKDIRPEQTQILHERGFLPVSVDYRLCPEVPLAEGPMSDVADALAWIRNVLPSLNLARPDVKVRRKVVTVGWSTGGTLAMSLAWNSIPRGIQPPDAVLALYCPHDYEDPFWQKPNVPAGSKTSKHASSLIDLDDETWPGVFDSPIKAYNVASDKKAVGGWMATADSRSRIALYMNHHGRTLQTLLRGLNKRQRNDPGKVKLDPKEIAAVSPVAHIRDESYKTPTFVIHPRQDDLIPWQQAEKTVDLLKERGVAAELRILEKVPHLFDVLRDWQRNEQADRVVREGYDFLRQQIETTER